MLFLRMNIFCYYYCFIIIKCNNESQFNIYFICINIYKYTVFIPINAPGAMYFSKRERSGYLR